MLEATGDHFTLISIFVLIGEAKNLLPYLGPNKMRDCFCTINLDQEEVYRTQVVEKSLRFVKNLTSYDLYGTH